MWCTVASPPVPSHPFSATELNCTLSFSVGGYASVAGSSSLKCGGSFKAFWSSGESLRIYKLLEYGARPVQAYLNVHGLVPLRHPVVRAGCGACLLPSSSVSHQDPRGDLMSPCHIFARCSLLVAVRKPRNIDATGCVDSYSQRTCSSCTLRVTYGTVLIFRTND